MEDSTSVSNTKDKKPREHLGLLGSVASGALLGTVACEAVDLVVDSREDGNQAAANRAIKTYEHYIDQLSEGRAGTRKLQEEFKHFMRMNGVAEEQIAALFKAASMDESFLSQTERAFLDSHQSLLLDIISNTIHDFHMDKPLTGFVGFVDRRPFTAFTASAVVGAIVGLGMFGLSKLGHAERENQRRDTNGQAPERS